MIIDLGPLSNIKQRPYYSTYVMGRESMAAGFMSSYIDNVNIPRLYLSPWRMLHIDGFEMWYDAHTGERWSMYPEFSERLGHPFQCGDREGWSGVGECRENGKMKPVTIEVKQIGEEWLVEINGTAVASSPKQADANWGAALFDAALRKSKVDVTLTLQLEPPANIEGNNS